MSHVIGIDLGTTNSCVAVVIDGKPTVIPNRAGYTTTPSVVAITTSGKRLVGQLAKRQAITNAQNTIFAAKRLIGRAWGSSQVEQMIKSTPYRILEGPHNDVRIGLAGKIYSLPEISSFILTEMKLIAEDFLKEEIEGVVITVPAYFNDSQRQATKDAGRIAGLDVLRIINEPTAAALAYGYGRQMDTKIAVYDLGGGTFDISILEVSDGVFDVLSTMGDTYLGGEDFDARIIEWMAFKFAEEHGVDLREDNMALQRLKDAAEQAKIVLSTSYEAEINLPFIWTDGGESKHLQLTLTREEFEDLVIDLIERTIGICEVTLEEAHLNKEDIDDVILVGGMTRMPLVREMVEAYFERKPSQNVHPDEAVAIGAAIQADSLFEGNDDILLLDVTPLSLGIAVHGGGFDKIIQKNTTVPVHRNRIFTTSHDNQTTIKIIVLQGESEVAAENELLGEFTLTDLRPAKAGELDIDIVFDIDANGIVRVSAQDLLTGRSQSIEVTGRSQLTEEEVREMMEKNQEYMLNARKDDSLETARTNLQNVLRQAERTVTLFSHADPLQPPSEELEAVQDFIYEARKVLHEEDLEKMIYLKNELQQAVHALEESEK